MSGADLHGASCAVAPRARRPRVAPGWIVVGLALAAGVARPALAEDALEDAASGSMVRYFIDSGHVTVRSFVNDATVALRKDLGLTLHWNNEKVTVPAIQAPVGSREAIDAITTASRPISNDAYRDFVKVRNELQAGLARGPATVDYYYSTESDYLAQQVGAHYNHDLAGRQLNLAVGTSYGWDAVEPLADSDTQTGPDTRTTLHGNVVATSILTPSSIVRFGVELNEVQGLQHNPYRHVYAGGTSVAERHPDHRQRADAFMKFNQYLPNRSSLKLNYRFYRDDWGIVSHEVGTRLAQYLTRGFYAQYQYRWYAQTAADFYRPEYETASGVEGYLTGDYRMGPLSSHLFGVSLAADLGVLTPDTPLWRRFGITLDYERYFNSNNYSADILETGVELRF